MKPVPDQPNRGPRASVVSTRPIQRTPAAITDDTPASTIDPSLEGVCVPDSSGTPPAPPVDEASVEAASSSLPFPPAPEAPPVAAVEPPVAPAAPPEPSRI